MVTFKLLALGFLLFLVPPLWRGTVSMTARIIMLTLLMRMVVPLVV